MSSSKMWCLGWAATRSLRTSSRPLPSSLAFVSSSWLKSSSSLLQQPIAYRNFVSKIYLEVDEQGRTIRKRPNAGAVGSDNDRSPRRRDGGGRVDGKGLRRWSGEESRSSNRGGRGNFQRNRALDNDDDDEYNYSIKTSRRSEPVKNNRRYTDDDDDDVVTPVYDNDDDSWDEERPARRSGPAKRTPKTYENNRDRREEQPRRAGRRDSGGDTSSSSSFSSGARRGRDESFSSSSSSNAPRRGAGGSGGRFNSFGSGNNNRRNERSPDNRRYERSPDIRRNERSPDNRRNERNTDNRRNDRSPDNRRIERNTDNRWNERKTDNRWNERNTDDAAAEANIIALGKTNMKALENAGFVHLYGLASCLNALRANRRGLSLPQDEKDRIKQLQQPLDVDEDDDEEEEDFPTEMDLEDDSSRKPEAQFRSWLFVQDQQQPSSTRSADKVNMVEDIVRLAQERNVPVAYVDRGVLNTLSGNRPHQGHVLRCGALSFEPLHRLSLPKTQTPTTDTSATSSIRLWLALDEVVDPQNLGALIRTAYFLGRVGILVCAKNSAPPSAVVSAASAGALEVATIYSTMNLPRTLQQARHNGFRIIGASSSPPPQPRRASRGEDEEREQDDEQDVEIQAPTVYDLHDLPTSDSQQPTVLVLGSEGHGLRKLVARACTEFVRIPSGNNEDDENNVDSLNVSVTGGILLWHLLRQQS